jgi:hypothetical protein
LVFGTIHCLGLSLNLKSIVGGLAPLGWAKDSVAITNP